MTQAPVTGLVKVTVASGARRVDLLLPGAVPVAELVPELARSVGLLDAATVYGGYRIVTSDGRELATDVGLIPQGVEDGGVLTVGAGVDRPAPRVYDDVVEAMTDVVEQDLRPWQPAAGRRTALVAAGLLLALGLVALYVQRASTIAGVAAAVVAAALVLGGIVLSRTQEEPETGVALAWMGTAYAAGAGLMLVHHQAALGLPLAAAGGSAMLAGLVAMTGLDEGRALAVPGIAVGAMALLAGLLVHLTSLSAAVVLMTVLAVAVGAGSVFPWLALGMTGTDVPQLYSAEDAGPIAEGNEPDKIDRRAVRNDARVAHEILVAISATVGLLLVLVAPIAVDRGLDGTLLALDAAAVIMLRTRQYRVGAEVLVGLVSGILGLVVIAASLLVFHPDWRPTVAVVLAAAGGLLLLGTLVPAEQTLRRGRAGDVLETTALLLLIPLVVLASGVLGGISV